MKNLIVRGRSLIVCGLCHAHLLFAQPSANPVIERALLLEELVWVQKKLNEIHPEPYHFVSQSDFEEKVEALKRNLKPMTKEEWYVELAGLISALHDGHTGLYYPDEDRQKYFDLGGKTFPFWVNLDDDGRVVIRQQYLQDDRLTDAAILEINGKPIHEVIEKMYPLTFGEAEVFRNSQISSSFRRMYWLLYGHTDSVALKTRLASGSIYEKNAACISLAQHDSITKILFPVTTMPKRTHMHFTHLNDRKVGLLTLRDFGTYKGYKDSISHVFRQIQEHAIDTLFLDLRGNGGGEHYITEEINQYLLRVPWVLVSKAKIKMSKEFYGIFPKSVRWLARVLPKKPAIKLAASIMTRNTKIEKVEKVLDSLTKAPTYEIHTRPKLHYAEKYFYSGNVFLLTDRNSYSMSGMFAAIMKDYQRAVIVGEETGGLANPHGQNVELTLPHSKFVFYVSTSRAYRPSGVFDNRGVIPDVPISYKILSRANSIEDLISLIAK
jgi:hypothetical protein